MPKKRINYALVGCGRVSKKHFEAIKHIKQANLYALCDIDNGRLETAGTNYGCAKHFDNFYGMLKDKNIDLISICTPSGLHAEMAIAAAKCKKHVILEKPMALNESDAKRILEAFRRSGASLTIMLQNRTNPTITFLQKHKKSLGKLLYINAHTYWHRRQEYYQDGWHGTSKMDGGVLMNQGTHFVDMIQYLVGSKATEVMALGGTFGHRMECEDAITVNLKFANGVIANIQANTLSYPENFEGAVTLFFKKATVKIGGTAMNKISHWKGVGEKETAKFMDIPISDIYGNGHYSVIKNMIDHLLKGKKLILPGKEGLPSLKIIETAYKSIKSEKLIHI